MTFWKTVIFVLSVIVADCVSSLECPEGILSKENCTVSSSSQNNDTQKIQEVTTVTSEPMSAPPALNMLSEEHLDSVFRPTPVPTSSNDSMNISKKLTEEPKGRALNFTSSVYNNRVLPTNISTHDEFGDLSDVSINENEDNHFVEPKILVPKGNQYNRSLESCEKGGLAYENGEKIENGCDSICTCMNSKIECEDRCTGPFFRKGKTITDPLCEAHDTDDPCCSILACASQSETDTMEVKTLCTLKNKTYHTGESFNIACEEVCLCDDGGRISCKPRCPSINKTIDRCVEVPDPNDSCCKKLLCDVTLDDNDSERDDEMQKFKIVSAIHVNESMIVIKFDPKLDKNDTVPIVELSNDKKDWIAYQILPNGYLPVQNDMKSKYIKLEGSSDIFNIDDTLVENNEFRDAPTKNTNTCSYKTHTFKINEEFNDNCTSLCVCKETGMKCLKLDCPTYFGTDVIDPHCTEWETVPKDFKATPPNCCPEQLRCKNNGSCSHKGVSYQNWQQVPTNVTGCEQRCTCELGKIECEKICPPVPALPPTNIPCPPHLAMIGHEPEDECCMYWICKSENSPTVPNKTTNETSTIVNEQITNEINGLFGLLPTNPSSKVLGPLIAYENQNRTNHFNISDSSSDVNPFLHKSVPTEIETIKSSIHKNKIQGNNKFDQNTFTIDSNYKQQSKTPTKRPNFVTPPNSLSDGEYITNSINPHRRPQVENPVTNAEQIHIHGKGNPSDLLQFIQQHPEIANYPAGSVLEIHSLPSKSIKHPAIHPFDAQNGIIGHPNLQVNSHLGPLIDQGPMNHQDPFTNLPPGITLEQILDEIHKSSQIHVPHPMYGTDTQQYPDHRQVPIAQQSGNILNRHNATQTGQSFPGGFPPNHGFPQPQDEITVHTLEAIDAHTVRLAFLVPPVIVGLHGRVEVRYTHMQNDNPDTWELQVFAPPNDLIATPQLEFDLLGLKADTEYRIKITITLRDLHNTPSSRIYKIKTPTDLNTTTLPPMIPIEPELAITDINATWVTVNWRKFTEYELQFIDGVQLRFKEIDGKIYAATPLIHRAITSYTLENLKPNTKYEIGIFFIPFPGQLTELHAEHMLHYTTANEFDTYGFNVTLDISHIKSTSIEITWAGVPYPEDKYVNIYRAIYQSDSGKEDQSTFKIAKRDSPTRTVIMDLKPGTRYRLWLEVYLTNGKIKTSNVQDFSTKPRVAPSLGASTQQDKLLIGEPLDGKGDYYGPLVIVAILAAIAILSTLILLLILVRRHNQNKAAITPPCRVSQSAYDNPTYKVEIQQETMGL